MLDEHARRQPELVGGLQQDGAHDPRQAEPETGGQHRAEQAVDEPQAGQPDEATDAARNALEDRAEQAADDHRAAQSEQRRVRRMGPSGQQQRPDPRADEGAADEADQRRHADQEAAGVALRAPSAPPARGSRRRRPSSRAEVRCWLAGHVQPGGRGHRCNPRLRDFFYLYADNRSGASTEEALPGETRVHAHRAVGARGHRSTGVWAVRGGRSGTRSARDRAALCGRLGARRLRGDVGHAERLHRAGGSASRSLRRN